LGYLSRSELEITPNRYLDKRSAKSLQESVA